jgi:ABC-2 type transport system permease protein
MMTIGATGFVPIYQRRLAIAVRRPVGLLSQSLTPVLWVLVVGPALARALGGFAHGVDYFSYMSVGQIVFILPFSAMFAGLTALFDRLGILREILVAPTPRATVPFANAAAVLTVAAGQFVLIVGLALARGAHFHTTPARLAIALAAAGLLSLGTYGLAEWLVYTITQPQAFGTLIPAIGVTPYALCGALYPISALPAGIRQAAWALPWTQCLDVLRFGLMGDQASGLNQIWPLGSYWAMAALSLTCLAGFAALMLTLALRAFTRSSIT